MNSNKKTTLLFIIIFIIFIGVSIYLLKLKNDSSTINIEENKEQKTELTPIEKPEKIEMPKTETEIKIPISQARFDEITKFIFSQNNIPLPKGLSIKEKIEIEKNREFYKGIFKNQNLIKEKQKEIDDYKNKLNEIENKKNELKKQTQTSKVKNEISDLEIDKNMYTNMLKRAEKFKQQLDENYETSRNDYEKVVIDDLNKIYQITN